MNNVYATFLVIGVCATIVCSVASFILWSNDENKHSKRMLIISFILASISAFCAFNYKDYNIIAYNKCVNLGYTETYKKSENYYCLLFGNEPKIYKLDDVNKP